jgi:hypothetical protein
MLVLLEFCAIHAYRQPFLLALLLVS